MFYDDDGEWHNCLHCGAEVLEDWTWCRECYASLDDELYDDREYDYLIYEEEWED